MKTPQPYQELAAIAAQALRDQGHTIRTDSSSHHTIRLYPNVYLKSGYNVPMVLACHRDSQSYGEFFRHHPDRLETPQRVGCDLEIACQTVDDVLTAVRLIPRAS